MAAFLEDLTTGQRTQLDPAIRNKIGRAVEANVRLEDPSVARCHAVIHHADGRWTLEDCLTTNGTMIRRGEQFEHLRSHDLQPGDVFRLGARVLQFLEDEIPAAR